MSRIVVEPIPPTRLPEKSGLVGCSITLDTDAGTLTWTGDSPRALRRPPTVLPLSGPGAVTTLLVVLYITAPQSPTQFMRLLFLSADGAVLVRSRPYLRKQFLDEWPAERLEQLREGGLRVEALAFGSTGELERAHRGAAPVASWASPPKVYLVAAVTTLLIIGIVLAVIAVAG
jgi:hypothetical protein